MTERGAVFPGVKKGNVYAKMLGESYNDMPKAVIAGIMVSLAYRLTGNEDPVAAVEMCRDEWRVLHNAGIIPQEPK